MDQPTSLPSWQSAKWKQCRRTKHKKKRTPTYYVRKDTIAALHEQIQSLEQELARARSCSHTAVSITAAIARHHLTIAGLESLISSYTQTPQSLVATPLASNIRLPKDQVERDRVLLSLRTPKLDAAYRFMTERTRFLDLYLHHVHEARVEQPNGDIVGWRFQTTTIDRRFRLAQVFDALKCVLWNQEAILSTVSAAKTVSRVTDDFPYRQSRIVTTIDCEKLRVESNGVTFVKFNETSGYVIASTDFVDVDESDDVQGDPCVRKECTSAMLVQEIATASGPIVSLCQWDHTRFRLRFPLAPDVVTQLYEDHKQQWEALLRVLHERLCALW